MKQQDGNLVGLGNKDERRLPPSDILLGAFDSPRAKNIMKSGSYGLLAQLVRAARS